MLDRSGSLQWAGASSEIGLLVMSSKRCRSWGHVVGRDVIDGSACGGGPCT